MRGSEVSGEHQGACGGRGRTRQGVEVNVNLWEQQILMLGMPIHYLQTNKYNKQPMLGGECDSVVI